MGLDQRGPARDHAVPAGRSEHGDADPARTGRPAVRLACWARREPADRPRVRRLRRMHPRRVPCVQLRGTVPDARYPLGRQGSREQLRDDVKMAYFGPKDAGTVIVSWGSTKGALLDALDRLWAEGAKIGYLHLRLINPFPVDAVRKFLAKAKRRIGVEMNFGAQLAGV